MISVFHKLKVKNIIRETAEAVSVLFEVPQALKEDFVFLPGQFLTLRLNVKGKELVRAYSMSSAPHEGALKVTVKQVPRGKVSTYINQQLTIGDEVEVMAPQGFFTAKEPHLAKDYYLIGGGSGITPLISIAKFVLKYHETSRVHLFYGNKDEDAIIFKQELGELQQQYDTRLDVEIVLAEPKREKKKGIGGLFSKGKTTWQGWKGLPSQQMVNLFLEKYPKTLTRAEYFICGPEKLMNLAELTLDQAGVSKDDVLIERFTKKEDPKVSGQEGVAKIALKGEQLEIKVKKDKTILDALLESGNTPPFSCMTGACSTCVAKVIEGDVVMEDCFGLEDAEVEKGYILTCQAKLKSPTAEISFDDL